MGSGNSKQLIVEGKDDKWFVINLLKAYGVAWPNDNKKWPLTVTDFGGEDKIRDHEKLGAELHETLVAARKIQGLGTLGILLDSDTDAAAKFQSLRDILSEFELPPRLPVDGLIHNTSRLRIGIWIMPDNQNNGNLETLLQNLIPDGAVPLWEHARLATAAAKQLGADYREVDQSKAELHTWLAWQDPPGRPYGTAIEARMLEVPNNKATTFAKWLNDLFDLNINFT